MDDPKTQAIKRAVAAKGSASALAVAIQISPQFMHQIVKGDRPLPARKAVLVERETGVRRWELFPDDWWLQWPDLIGADGAPDVPDCEPA